MPGPGGGGHSGGGHGGGHGGGRGGGFGGGHGGRPGGFHGGPGGFHGGPGRRPPHRHGFFFGPWYHRPYYYGGGCLGGFMGMLLVPVVLLLVAVLMMVSVLGASCQALTSGGEVVYDEDTMQTYVDTKYARVYGASEAYEDHILLVFLVDEDHSQFDYYAWLGYDLDQQVRNAFSAPFQSTVQSTVHDPYTYSLTADLTDVVDAMATRVTALGLSSPFKCGEAHADVAPAFCNNSQMALDEARVLAALQQFTAQTGISISLAVEDRVDVFGTYYPVLPLIFSLLLFGGAIYLIVRVVRQRNRGDNDQDDGWNTYGSSSQSDGW